MAPREVPKDQREQEGRERMQRDGQQVIGKRVIAEEPVKDPEGGVQERVVHAAWRRAGIRIRARPSSERNSGRVMCASSSHTRPPCHAGWYAASVAASNTASSTHAVREPVNVVFIRGRVYLLTATGIDDNSVAGQASGAQKSARRRSDARTRAPSRLHSRACRGVVQLNRPDPYGLGLADGDGAVAHDDGCGPRGAGAVGGDAERDAVVAVLRHRAEHRHPRPVDTAVHMQPFCSGPPHDVSVDCETTSKKTSPPAAATSIVSRLTP